MFNGGLVRDRLVARVCFTCFRYKQVQCAVSLSSKSRARGNSLVENKNSQSKSKSKSKSKSFGMDSDGGKVFESGKFSQLYNKKPVNLDSALEKITDFGQLKIFPSVREAMVMDIKSQYNLKNTQYKSIDEVSIRPTPVQIAAIRKTNKSRKLKSDAKLAEMSQGERIQYELQNENEMNKIKIFTIAAETGSGKTWAYLASVLSKLKEDDFNWFCQSQDKLQRFKSSQQVRSVILVPTHELVEQVYENLQRANSFKLANDVGVPKQYHEFLQLPENQTLGLSIMKLSHGDAPIKLFKKLRHEGKIDVLVTTPGKITGFSKLDVVDRPFKVFKSVRYCVLDEADTLFDKSFLNDTTSVVKNFPNLLDLILVSATIPKEFEKTLSRLFPDDNSLIRVATPSLHKIPKSIKIMTLDADLSPYNGSKTRCLAQAIYAISKDGTEPDHVKRIIVFVNEKSEVEGLVELMKKKYNIREQDICGISGQVHVGDRKEFLEPFVRPAQLLKDDLDQSKVKILVTTDLLSRGLNFVGIKNVILLGLPKSSVELVHRLGRTGRMNQSGRAFIIVDKKSKKSWVKGLGSAILRGIKIG